MPLDCASTKSIGPIQTIADKIKGFEEEIKGKITKKPELVEQGRKRMSGELKREERKRYLEVGMIFTR